MIELLLWPFVAGLVLTAIHVWLGLHVLARGVVFVDLSLAQVAALGLTVAIYQGYDVQSDAGYWYALAFALGGALLFALTRRFEGRIQQEAIIGIVYAVSAALGVLALDRAPQGAEHVKQLLIGSILTVSPAEVAGIALLYATIGALHLVVRRPMLAASHAPPSSSPGGRSLLLWDIVFYISFALVVTSSVRVAGVLLVFAYLIVPAALAGTVASGVLPRLLVGWMLGVTLTGAGLYASWIADLPTGPAIVSAFGAAMVVAAAVFALRRMSRVHWLRLLAGTSVVAGALLVAFPRMDQPWLDALERVVPSVQTAFLHGHEREMRRDTLHDIERARGELQRLRALEQDALWGRAELSPEKLERLRQYLAGRGEISAGDELVLRHLGRQARARQRWWIGLPLLALGIGGLLLARRQRVQSGFPASPPA